jgi:hypothetical protein
MPAMDEPGHRPARGISSRATLTAIADFAVGSAAARSAVLA